LRANETNVVSPEVGLELPREDLERRRLSDTVSSYETEDLSRTGRRQSVELERVGRVPVGHLGLEVGGKVNDGDGLERAPRGRDSIVASGQ
jgi:hypothetical protein